MDMQLTLKCPQCGETLAVDPGINDDLLAHVEPDQRAAWVGQEVAATAEALYLRLEQHAAADHR